MNRRKEKDMTPNQRMWAQARVRLARAVTALGFPGELADLLARLLFAPTELSISLVTSILGAPVVIKIMTERRLRHA